MISQQAVALTFYAHFVDTDGVSVTGLTVTVDVYEGVTATPIVAAASATELANGLYYYTLSGGSVDADGAYIAVFETASTSVAQRHLPALQSVGNIINADVVAMDADVVTASALAADAVAEINATVDTAISDAALATAANLATVDTVVDSILADTGTDGVVVAAASKTGYTLSAAGIQAIWDALTSALTTVGSIGKLLVDNINATISSRASQTSVDDVPTNAELATALGTADDATLAAIAALNDLSAAQVNAEVLDVLVTDTFAEPSAVPAATSSLKDKINWLFILARNKLTQTATTQLVRNDADSATVGTSTVSDDGTTATRGEFS